MSNYYLYKKMPGSLKNLYQKLLLKVDNGEMYSLKIRKLYHDVYGIDVGLYTYGCFDYKKIAPNIRIGKYCSFAQNVSIVPRREHSLNYASTHPFFFNAFLGMVDKHKIPFKDLVIGHDVWIGQGAIICSSCCEIGEGAVIGAGSVVTKNIPPYAIVAGVPAKIIRYRFDNETIENLSNSKWYMLEAAELQRFVNLAENPTLFADEVAKYIGEKQ